MAENDVFSALNVGSGLNTTELIKNLIEAERAPKEEKITNKIETTEVSISAIAELKKTIKDSNDVIDDLDGTNVFAGNSTSTAVSLTVDDPAKIKEMVNSITISKLARGQTLVYDGFSSATSNIGSGTLIFQRGEWNNGTFTEDTTYNSKQVIIGDTSYTLNDVKDAINQGNVGITASVIKKTADDYALALRAETGASNSFEIRVVEGNNAGLNQLRHAENITNTTLISSASAGATITASSAHGLKVGDTVKYIAAGTALNGLTSLSSYKVASVGSTTFTLTNTDGTSVTYGGSGGNANDKFVRTNKETLAGQDAAITLDGVSITRSKNSINDLIDGATINLASTTTKEENISVTASKSKVLEALENLIEEVNGMSEQMQALLERGLDGGEKGALAGDVTVRNILQKLKKITTEPIYGYAEKPIFLTNLGVSTNQDGMLTLNERVFNDAFVKSPQDLTALFTDRLHSSSSLITPKLSGSAYEPGRYSFDIGTQGYLSGTSPVTTDITSNNFTPSSGSENLVVTIDGVQSGTIQVTGGPYSTTSALSTALENAINSDNALAVKQIGVTVKYSNNRYIITSKTFGSKSTVAINSIDAGLQNYLGIQGGAQTNGTGSEVGASLTDTPLSQYTGGFRSISGKAMGLSLQVTAPGSNAFIYIGKSYLSSLSNYFNEVLKPSGMLSSRTDALNKELSTYNEDLMDLDEEIEKSTERYKQQYGAMEATVNSLKNTGEYLTSYMDAQKQD